MTAPVRAPSAGRDAATVTAWNLVSRLTGLLRVVVLGGALGTSRLGDTYQASNQVSNILFELLAAGTLSAVLVPGLVERLTHRDRDDARAFAGALLARALAAMAVVVVVGLACAHPLVRLLFAGNSSPSRDAQVRLGAFLLLFVLPQLLLYAWGAIVTALLHADGRFAAAACAPVANNVVVTLGLALFWWRGAHGLDLATADKWLLGAAALGGVAAMTLVPAVAAWRAGLSVRPRWSGATVTRAVRRDIGWASLVVIPAQLVLLGSLLVAGRVDGGVVAYQIAFTFFLLPHALLGHPVTTVLYPRLAAAQAGGDRPGLDAHVRAGVDAIAFVLLPAAALLATLAPSVIRVATFGAALRGNGPDLLAAALAGLVLGLPAYSLTLFLTRVDYALGDVRRPSLAALAGAGAAAVVLVAATTVSGEQSVVRTIALAYATMALTSMLWLGLGLHRAGVGDVALGRLVRFLVAACGAALVAGAVSTRLPDVVTRADALVTLVVAGGAGAIAYAAVLVASGVRRLPRLSDAAA